MSLYGPTASLPLQGATASHKTGIRPRRQSTRHAAAGGASSDRAIDPGRELESGGTVKPVRRPVPASIHRRPEQHANGAMHEDIADNGRRLGVPEPHRTLLGVLVAVTLMTACDPSFNVIKESDLYYSVSGFLDAGADTQWVRITALGGRPSSGLGVTLTEAGSGRHWVLRDSLFQFDGGGNAHNYWAPARLRPGGAYRLEIDDGAGRLGRIEVALPDSFPNPVYDPPPYAFQEKFDGLLVISGVALPAAVDFIYGFSLPWGKVEVPISHLKDLDAGPRDFSATINWALDLRQLESLGPGYETIRSLKIRVTAASPGWPGPPGISYGDSPVENGIGYVGGLFTREVTILVDRGG
jgi:hypothetical protein